LASERIHPDLLRLSRPVPDFYRKKDTLPTQEVQGSLFGMSQSKANMWIHLLHAVLNRALAVHGDLPKRTFIIEEADLDTEQRESVMVDAARDDTPFSFMMEQNDQ
jgi:hypothetical protein